MDTGRLSPIGRALAVVLLLGGLAACATAGTSDDREGNTLLIVENNLIPSTSLSVYAVPESGVRRLVGTVNPGATATLSFDPVATPGQYRFVAVTTAGGDITSNPLTLTRGATVEWDLSANLARVTASG